MTIMGVIKSWDSPNRLTLWLGGLGCRSSSASSRLFHQICNNGKEKATSTQAQQDEEETSQSKSDSSGCV